MWYILKMEINPIQLGAIVVFVIIGLIFRNRR